MALFILRRNHMGHYRDFSLKAFQDEFEEKMKKDKYYISDRFEIVQIKGCGNGNDAMIAKGVDYNDAIRICNELGIEIEK